MPCTAENGFVPELPKEVPDMIYLCFPNNPTGAAITKDELQKWVDYANKNGAASPKQRQLSCSLTPTWLCVSATSTNWILMLR